MRQRTKQKVSSGKQQTKVKEEEEEKKELEAGVVDGEEKEEKAPLESQLSNQSKLSVATTTTQV